MKANYVLKIVRRFDQHQRHIHQLIEKSSSVIISQADNIYTNLAVEDWLFQQLPKYGHKSWYHLLLWCNKPCVVIGKHQNPWYEVRVGRCNLLNLPIARRKSGGGTVYHDQGNLNLCFLSDPKTHSRKRNNQFIIDVLAQKYGISCEINERDNLITKNGGFKISGTASKLTRNSTYHHCTLLVNADLTAMHQVIWKGSNLIDHKATPSVHSSVQNLSELSSNITMDSLIKNICDKFTELTINFTPWSFCTPEIESIEKELREWDWIYGKTPSFNINSSHDGLTLKMIVTKGLIDLVETNPIIDLSLLIGCKFTIDDVQKCLANTLHSQNPPPALVKGIKCVLNTINSIYCH